MSSAGLHQGSKLPSAPEPIECGPECERRVLILAPTAGDSRVSANLLSQSGANAEACHTLRELCRKIQEGAGAVILAEEALGASSIGELGDVLAKQPSWSEIPVLILVSREASSDARLRRLKTFGLSGAIMLIERPIHPATLVSAVEVAMRSRQRQYQVRDLLEKTRADSERLREAQEALRLHADDLEIKVSERTEALRSTIGELEAFSYSVSHDLRSPLRAMQGYSDVLLSEYKDKLDATGADYLHRIRRAAGRMDMLIQDILAYSRVAKGEIQLQEINVANVVRDVIQSYPALQPDRATITIEGEIPLVLGHEAYITQIVSNLLANAAKFVADKQRPVIKISATIQDGMVRIVFEDNGIGIAKSDQEQIFQIFGRVYSEKRFEGTGIGLAIARKAAERMGGSLGVESEVGRGSKFCVLLKRAEAA
jgi:signal transduction histidine kinase